MGKPIDSEELVGSYGTACSNHWGRIRDTFTDSLAGDEELTSSMEGDKLTSSVKDKSSSSMEYKKN